MTPSSPVFPPTASTLAPEVDALFFFMLAGSAFFTVLIVVVILVFIVKYRRRTEDGVGEDVEGKATRILEITWSVIPLVLLMIGFFWGVKVYFRSARPPANAMELFVIGKQWMWKIEHPSGKREINQLHVPVGQPVKLTMTSEDVIHDFSIPAFRMKMDVIPGRYTTAWFEATKPGVYHLFCDQYCGTDHSKMAGQVVVLPPHEYEAWLAGAGTGPLPVASGEELFVSKGCATCHRPDSSARAPILTGAFGKPVTLLDGKSTDFDDTYLRESIVNPGAKVVHGYQPIMPTFKDQLTEEEIMQLVRYVRDLKSQGNADVPAAAGAGRSS
jgi:cytochrome c oxidase subunit 2